MDDMLEMIDIEKRLMGRLVKWAGWGRELTKADYRGRHTHQEKGNRRRGRPLLRWLDRITLELGGVGPIVPEKGANEIR